VHKAQGYFRDIPDDKPSEELLELAEALITKRSGDFHPQDFHDRYVDALKDLIERKRKAKGKTIIDDKDSGAKTGSNVVDLMAALKKSMEKAGGTAAAETKAPVKKAPAKTAAKAPAKTPAKKRA